MTFLDSLEQRVHDRLTAQRQADPTDWVPPAWVVLTPRQIQRVKMDARSNYLVTSGSVMQIIGCPVLPIFPSDKVENWLFSESCIDMRSDDE